MYSIALSTVVEGVLSAGEKAWKREGEWLGEGHKEGLLAGKTYRCGSGLHPCPESQC